MSQTDNTKTRERFPTFRRWFARFGKLPFVSRAWWKRNFRRVAFVGLFLVFVWTAVNIYATVLLNRELTAIRERGEPLTMAELAPPAVPDKENAALVYKSAAELLTKIGMADDKEQKMLESYQQNNPAFSRQEFVATRRRLLVKYAPAIALIRQGAILPSCVFPRNWKQNAFLITFPEYLPMRNFARLMSAQAKQNSADGKTDQAIEDVAVIYRLSEHLSNEHIAIGLLVRRTIEMLGHDALARIFEYSNVSAQQKVVIENMLPRADLRQALKKVLQFERAFATAGFDNFFSYDENSGVENTPFSIGTLAKSKIARVVWSPVTKLDEVWFLRAHPANSQAVPFEEIPSYASITRELLPVFSRLQKTIQATETVRKMAHIALALNAYRTVTKNYPTNLAQLEAQNKTRLPLDAYSDKPFIYRRTPNGYTLYSVGANKKDDGGRTEKDVNRAPTRSINGSLPDWDDIRWPPNQHYYNS